MECEIIKKRRIRFRVAYRTRFRFVKLLSNILDSIVGQEKMHFSKRRHILANTGSLLAKRATF